MKQMKLFTQIAPDASLSSLIETISKSKEFDNIILVLLRSKLLTNA